MAYQLFSYTVEGRIPVTFTDLDNKPFWCKHGEKQEEAFVKRMSTLQTPYSITIHPEKKTNPFHPDLLIEYKNQTFMGEVKIKNSPLFYAKSQYGIDNQYALTMDLKDSFNYSNLLNDGIDLVIFIWVNWDAHEMARRLKSSRRAYEQRYYVQPMEGIWVTRFSRLRHLEKAVNPPPIHWYKESFRKPPVFRAKEHPRWCELLLDLDSRLQQSKTHFKNITSDGYKSENGHYYPTGHSSGSYVFELKDGCFKELFCKI